MAKLISISLLDEEVSYESLMEALNKLSSRDLRKYFKRKKMAFPRNVRYAFLTKCIKRDFQAVQKDLLSSDSRVFTEFELVEFYRCVENPVLAQEFKKDFLADFVKKTYKNLLTDKNLADLYLIANSKEEVADESIYEFLVGLNPIFTDTEDNNLDCLPVETTAQRIKDQFTLFEVREFAKKYGVVVPKYPNAELVTPVVIEKAESRQLLDEDGLANLQDAEVNTVLSFAKKNGIYAPRYLKKDEIIDEVISQIASKEIDNARMNEVFNSNLITFKARSSSDSLADLLDKYENLDDLSEVRNDNSKDMSPLKRCAVGGAIGLELRYNEETRKARLLERRKKLELLRQQALERKERLARERREQDLISQRDTSDRLKNEEEARRLAAEERIRELEALLAKQDEDKAQLEEALKEEEAKRLAAEKALEEAPKYEVVEEETEVPEEVIEESTEEVVDEFANTELVNKEFFEAVVHEEVEVEEDKEVTYMAFEVVEEPAYVPETVEAEIIPVETEEEIVEEEEAEEPIEEAIIEEEVIEEPVEEEVIEEEQTEEEPIEEVEEEKVEEPKEEETPVEETEEPKEEEEEKEPQPEPVRCPVKKLHIFGWIISILVLAGLACAYFLVSSVQSSISNLLDANATLSATDYAILLGYAVGAFGVVAFIIRSIIHKIRCKAKKGIACCKVCEVYKYLWAHLVVTVIAAFAFIQAKLFHFDAIATSVGNILQKILNNNDLTAGEGLVALLGIIVLGYVLSLIICSLAHALRRKKGCKPGFARHFIKFSWTLTILIVIEGVALFVLYPSVLTSIIGSFGESIKATLSLTFAPLVVLANDGGVNPSNGPTIIQIAYTVILAVVALYLLSLIGMTIGVVSHDKKQKTKEAKENEEANEETEVEETVNAETPVQEDVVKFAEEPQPIVEEEGEKLLFTTFEEAKLVEDLNDLNRMIGKVNEHVKDLSAIQARLYNELVGEEEIVIEPPVQEEHVVIPETPVSQPQIQPEPPVQEEVVEEEVNEEAPKKEKVKCKVRTGHKVAWILTLIIAIALAVMYFIPVPAVKNILVRTWNVFKTNEIKRALDLACYGGALFLAIALLAFLVRTLVHPLGCKAKKGKPCLQRKENIRYLWTAVLFGISAIVLLTVNNWHNFKDIISTAWGRVNSFDFASFGIYEYGVLGAILVFVIFIIGLLVKTFSRSKESKKARKEAKKTEEAVEIPEEINSEEVTNEIAPLEAQEEVREAAPNTLKEKYEKKAAKKKTKKEARKERKAKVASCPIRKMQKGWLVITLLLLIAAVVCYFVLPVVKSYVDAKVALFTAPRSGWTTLDHIVLFGTLFVLILIVSFLVRFILHPLGCKAKKDRICCKVCEWYKYLWTVIFVSIITVALLVLTDTLNFGLFYNQCVKFVTALMTNFDFKALTRNQIILLVGIVVAVIALIIIIIKTFAHKTACRREEKALELERMLEEEARKQAEEEAKNPYQQGVMYIPCFLNGAMQFIPVNVPQANQNPFNQNPFEPKQAQVVEDKVEEVEATEKVDKKSAKKAAKEEAKRNKKEAKKAKKAKLAACPVRKMQKGWLVVTLLLLVAAVVCYFVLPVVKSYVDAKIALFTAPRSGWTTLDHIVLFGTLFVLVLIVSFIVRCFLHRLGCKAKKGKHCCKVCEWYKYIWTVIFLGILTVVALVLTKTFSFDYFYNRAVAIVSSLFTNFDLKSLTRRQILLLVGLAVIAILLVVIIIKTLAHKVICGKETKIINEIMLEEQEEEQMSKAKKEQNPLTTATTNGLGQPIYITQTVAGQPGTQTTVSPYPVVYGTPAQPIVVQMPAQQPVVYQAPAQPIVVQVPAQQPQVNVQGYPVPYPVYGTQVQQPVEETKKTQKAKKEKVAKQKVKCPVRKMQKGWLIVTLLAVIAAVVAYFLLPAVKSFVDSRWEFYNTVRSNWTLDDHILLFGAVGLFILVISFLVRCLLHPLGCKAKKGRHCCKVCEWYKYLWTVIFVGAVTVLGLAYGKFLNFNIFYEKGLNIVKTTLGSFSLATIKALTRNQTLVLIGLVVGAIALVVIIIATLVHTARCAREAKLEAKEAALDAANPVANSNVQFYGYPMNNGTQAPVQMMNPYANPYTPGMYEDINSPYNTYRVGKSHPKAKVSGSKVKGFFKFLGVLLVLVAAYAVCAYFVDALPLHDQIRNLVQNIF